MEIFAGKTYDAGTENKLLLKKQSGLIIFTKVLELMLKYRYVWPISDGCILSMVHAIFDMLHI